MADTDFESGPRVSGLLVPVSGFPVLLGTTQAANFHGRRVAAGFWLLIYCVTMSAPNHLKLMVVNVPSVLMVLIASPDLAARAVSSFLQTNTHAWAEQAAGNPRSTKLRRGAVFRLEKCLPDGDVCHPSSIRPAKRLRLGLFCLS